MKFRTGFNVEEEVFPDGPDAVLECKDESRTIQSQAEDADINVIVARFMRTGQLPVIERPPLEWDFMEVVDFHDAVALVKDANDKFMMLPANVRTRFNNDPGQFVDFCSDEANLGEMRKMGLAVPEPVVPAPAAASTSSVTTEAKPT